MKYAGLCETYAACEDPQRSESNGTIQKEGLVMFSHPHTHTHTHTHTQPHVCDVREDHSELRKVNETTEQE